MRFLILILLLITFTSCKEDSVQFVEIHPAPPNLEITNHTNRAIFFYAIEQEFSEKIRLADPCLDFQPNLPADTTLLFPYENILGYDEEAEKVWFWWTDCVNNSEMDTFELYSN